MVMIKLPSPRLIGEMSLEEALFWREVQKSIQRRAIEYERGAPTSMGSLWDNPS